MTFCGYNQGQKYTKPSWRASLKNTHTQIKQIEKNITTVGSRGLGSYTSDHYTILPTYLNFEKCHSKSWKRKGFTVEGRI